MKTNEGGEGKKISEKESWRCYDATFPLFPSGYFVKCKPEETVVSPMEIFLA